jgi:hypothetical protein
MLSFPNSWLINFYFKQRRIRSCRPADRQGAISLAKWCRPAASAKASGHKCRSPLSGRAEQRGNQFFILGRVRHDQHLVGLLRPAMTKM